MELTTVWFLLIAVLWVGYFVLEGFDFGVGMLLPVLGRDDRERKLVLDTIGPVWDGNEVWLIVAGGATFAAFPEWYASLFAGFYLALFGILVALILRGVAIEYRGKAANQQERYRWDRALFVGSVLPPLLWGVGFANIVHGVPLDAEHHFTGSLLTLLKPYALLGGITVLGLSALHGAVFLALRTDGPVRHRARLLAWRLAGPVVVVAAAFLVWTQLDRGTPATGILALAAALALVGGVLAVRAEREGLAFAATAATIALAVVTLFVALWPDVLPSTVDPAANSLTVHNASSTPYTLKVMTWVAGVFVPVVLAYQAWTYWVFRSRLRPSDPSPVATPPGVPS